MNFFLLQANLIKAHKFFLQKPEALGNNKYAHILNNQK